MQRWRRRLGLTGWRFWATLTLMTGVAGIVLVAVRGTHDKPPANGPKSQGKHARDEDAGSAETEKPKDFGDSPNARLERLVVTKIEGHAPGDDQAWSNPSFQLYHGLSDDELRDLRRDPAWVVDRLFSSITQPGDEAHRQKVLRALVIYLEELETPEQARRFVTQGIDRLASATLPIGLETDLASAIAGHVHSWGIKDADRVKFRERARVVLAMNLPHPDYAKVWAWGLAQLGGPEEKQIVLNAWNRLDSSGRSKILETGFVQANER